MALHGLVSHAQRQGPREYQEDRIVHIPFVSKTHGQGHLLAVFDGHGGSSDVSQYCAQFLPQIFDSEAQNVEQELAKVVGKLDARTALAHAGTTVSLACILEARDSVTTALLGDSPIIVVDHRGRALMSEEHNVRSNGFEREAVIRRGGKYDDDGYIHRSGGNDYLQLSRALGNRAIRNILDQTPVIKSYRLSRKSLVLVASDGLIDPSHEMDDPEAVPELLAKARTTPNAESVLEWKENTKPGLQDNASLIMWRPEKKKWWNWL